MCTYTYAISICYHLLPTYIYIDLQNVYQHLLALILFIKLYWNPKKSKQTSFLIEIGKI